MAGLPTIYEASPRAATPGTLALQPRFCQGQPGAQSPTRGGQQLCGSAGFASQFSATMELAQLEHQALQSVVTSAPPAAAPCSEGLVPSHAAAAAAAKVDVAAAGMLELVDAQLQALLLLRQQQELAAAAAAGSSGAVMPASNTSSVPSSHGLPYFTAAELSVLPGPAAWAPCAPISCSSPLAFAPVQQQQQLAMEPCRQAHAVQAGLRCIQEAGRAAAPVSSCSPGLSFAATQQHQQPQQVAFGPRHTAARVNVGAVSRPEAVQLSAPAPRWTSSPRVAQQPRLLAAVPAPRQAAGPRGSPGASIECLASNPLAQAKLAQLLEVQQLQVQLQQELLELLPPQT